MASVVDSAAEGVHDASGRGRWSLKGMARRPEFGAVVATALVYLFFAITTQGAGFVSIDGTAGWLDTAAELGIIYAAKQGWKLCGPSFWLHYYASDRCL